MVVGLAGIGEGLLLVHRVGDMCELIWGLLNVRIGIDGDQI